MNDFIVNEKIKCKTVRAIGTNGEVLGILPTYQALQVAKDNDLDLVLVSPNSNPPVAKILDYGKYRYDCLRKEKENNKKQKSIEVKEVQVSPQIALHDLNVKLEQAKKFLSKGNKVKFTLRFRGREIMYKNGANQLMSDICTKLSDIAVIDAPMKLDGRILSVILKGKE